MITYKEACDIVFSASKFGICLGLERMEQVLLRLGNPEKAIPMIHLAGTNGKGSTLTYLTSIFQEAGFTVGTYTSPAIQRINDKIQVNGVEVPDEDFARLIGEMKPVLDEVAKTEVGAPTEFEIMTALAFQYFSTVAKPDIVLVETGLGGRLDSTNVVTPLVSIITTIGHDHMDLLGNTLEAVAREKAGIIKQAVPVVSGCKQESVIEVIKARALEMTSAFYQLDQHFQIKKNQTSFDFQWDNEQYQQLKAGMLGSHQQDNAALAVMAIQLVKKQYKIEEEQIRSGLKKARIANRIEVIQENPTIIFDGGHNREGIEALANTLATSYPNKTIRILFCAMKDKDIEKMIQPLEQIVEEMVLTSFNYERAMNPFKIKEAHQSNKILAIDEARIGYDYLLSKTTPQDVLVITGSLYFLAYMRKVTGK